MSLGGGIFRTLMCPGTGFVVYGPGVEAAVQDDDEPVGELARPGAMGEAAGALLAVIRTGTGRYLQRRLRLPNEHVDEPVVVDEAGCARSSSCRSRA